MSVPTDSREHDASVQRRWLALHGAVQADIPLREAGDLRWRGLARCGPAGEHPSPELFFPDEADSQSTYAARDVCLRCPVRELCDKWATDRDASGVWGGIHRNSDGWTARLCTTAGCMQYRQRGHRHCTACYAVIHAERDAEKDPGFVERGRRAAVTAAAHREVVPV
jgi:hypothetical protein